MTNAQMLKKLVALEPELDIVKVEEIKEKGKVVKVIHVLSTRIKVKCIHCNKFTRCVHDKLKPIKIKYLDMAGYTTYLMVYKRRFNCLNCGKRFTEDNYINGTKKTLSYKLEQKILMDLRDYNLSLTYIAEHNNVSDNKVRKILKDYMKNQPTHLRNLPSVISFDEFKADTRNGKYAFIINDLLHKKTLDVLPSRILYMLI